MTAEDYSEMLRGTGGGGGGRGSWAGRDDFYGPGPRAIGGTARAAERDVYRGGRDVADESPGKRAGWGAFYGAFQRQITEFIAFTRTGFITLMLNNVATCQNIANNLGRYATTPPLDVLRNAFQGCRQFSWPRAESDQEHAPAA